MNLSKQNRRSIYSIFITLTYFVSISLLNSCNVESPPISKTGIVTGNVSIGPLCPVATDPPDPNCLPTQETYNAWPVAIWSSDKKTKIGQIKPNSMGDYVFELPEGNYILDLEILHFFGSNLPATIKITSQETTVFNIDIDTGIR